MAPNGQVDWCDVARQTLPMSGPISLSLSLSLSAVIILRNKQLPLLDALHGLILHFQIQFVGFQLDFNDLTWKLNRSDLEKPKFWPILIWEIKNLTNSDLKSQISYLKTKILTNFDLGNRKFDKFWPENPKFWP